MLSLKQIIYIMVEILQNSLSHLCDEQTLSIAERLSQENVERLFTRIEETMQIFSRENARYEIKELRRSGDNLSYKALLINELWSSVNLTSEPEQD